MWSPDSSDGEQCGSHIGGRFRTGCTGIQGSGPTSLTPATPICATGEITKAAKIKLSLKLEGGQKIFGWPRADGQFILHNVPEGTWLLDVVAPGLVYPQVSTNHPALPALKSYTLNPFDIRLRPDLHQTPAVHFPLPMGVPSASIQHSTKLGNSFLSLIHECCHASEQGSPRL